MKMRIEQYIQMIDYALWEVIENGATLPKTTIVEGVVTVMPITTAEEKAQRRLEVKARNSKACESVELLMKVFHKKDVNQKLLRVCYLSGTHMLLWENKADLDTMSMDDLYNNLKVYEPEVKGMSSSSSSTQNMAFMSSSNNNTSSTNEAVNTAHGVSTTSTQESSRRSVPVETSTSIALVSCDGLGRYDWSDQAKEGPNYALMSYSSSSPDSEVSNDSICSKSCLKTIESLKSQNDQLLKDLKKYELMVLAYKTSLESVEEKLEVYKANESIYLQDIKELKFEIHLGEIDIREIKKKLEIVQKNEMAFNLM
ncbi:hypothetical protein Tco_0570718 [Tanacetum coccineum]